MKEYEIQDLELSKRYVQPALIWYRKKHLATMDGFGPEWNVPKPPKNFDERVARTKVQLKTGSVVAGKVLHEVRKSVPAVHSKVVLAPLCGFDVILVLVFPAGLHLANAPSRPPSYTRGL